MSANVSDSLLVPRRIGMANNNTDARTVDAGTERTQAIDSVARHVQKLLGASAVHMNRSSLPQIAVECEERANGIGFDAILVIIPADGAARYDTFWGFGWRDALEGLVEWVEDARHECSPAHALETVMDCADAVAPWWKAGLT